MFHTHLVIFSRLDLKAAVSYSNCFLFSNKWSLGPEPSPVQRVLSAVSASCLFIHFKAEAKEQHKERLRSSLVSQTRPLCDSVQFPYLCYFETHA